jgi:hypothetical protein
MPTEHILQLLVAERDRLQKAIDLLGGTSVKHRGRPRKTDSSMPEWVGGKTAAKPRKKRIFTAAQKSQQAKRMKAYWASKRKAAKSAKAEAK